VVSVSLDVLDLSCLEKMVDLLVVEVNVLVQVVEDI